MELVETNDRDASVVRVGREGLEAMVEGHEPEAGSPGQGKQVSIGDLPVTDEHVERNLGARGEGNVVRKKSMPGKRSQRLEPGDRFSKVPRLGPDPRVARNANERGLGQGAGGPADIAMLGKPTAGSAVVEMIGPGQGEQDIDVQQRRQVRAHRRAVPERDPG